ncbi:MAG: heavy-metal-associated domain-containing protein [Nitrospiraceae bacterium]|nr:heavy-metal-associated domain-containing protein [Nitrospiraceae bacterium]
MEKIFFDVKKEFCQECSMALRRFVGKMEGVESVDIENGKIALEFDSRKITPEELSRITRESIEKLGYKTE